MRADFTLFDEYDHTHTTAPPFAFPLTAFWGTSDRRIKQRMVQVCGRVGGAMLWLLAVCSPPDVHSPPVPPCSLPATQGWSRFTTSAFELHQVEGHHLWPLEKGSKAAWLAVIAEQLAALPL